MDFTVRSNNCSVREACTNCGGEFKADIPYWFFAPGTYNGFCEQCVRKEDPELYEIIQNHNELFFREIQREDKTLKSNNMLMKIKADIELYLKEIEEVEVPS